MNKRTMVLQENLFLTSLCIFLPPLPHYIYLHLVMAINYHEYIYIYGGTYGRSSQYFPQQGGNSCAVAVSRDILSAARS